VRREDGFLLVDLPSRPPKPIPVPDALTKALGATPTEAGMSRDLMAVFDDEEVVRELRPDFRALAALGPAVIATAPGRDIDFVSRFFAPGDGIDEDPVTGSAHCTLIPYWTNRLGRAHLRARQVSARGGDLTCRDLGSRVSVGGRATLYLEGTIRV
jgi:predicted PhzF superfamily epimerase YddE/YHI9